MKKNLTFLFIIFSLFSKGQGTDRQTIDSKIIRTWGSAIECKFIRSIENADTSEYFIMVFQNAKYTAISDIVIIIKNNQNELDSFIADAESVQNWILENKGRKASYSKNEFYVNTEIFPTRGHITITSQNERDMGGYTFLTYKTFPIFIEYLKSRKVF
jgi:hypothetical protein